MGSDWLRGWRLIAHPPAGSDTDQEARDPEEADPVPAAATTAAPATTEEGELRSMMHHWLRPHRRFVAAVQSYKSTLSIGGSGSQALIGCEYEDCLWTETKQFPVFTPEQVRAALKFPDVSSRTPYQQGGIVMAPFVGSAAEGDLSNADR